MEDSIQAIIRYLLAQENLRERQEAWNESLRRITTPEQSQATHEYLRQAMSEFSEAKHQLGELAKVKH